MSENQAYYKRRILEVIMRVPIMCLFASVVAIIFIQLVLDLNWNDLLVQAAAANYSVYINPTNVLLLHLYSLFFK